MRHLLAVLVPVLFLAGCQKSAPMAPAPAAPSAPVATTPAPARAPAETYAERTRSFLTAAEKGQVSRLLDLLGKGADVNDKDEAGDTALHRAAAEEGHAETLVVLIRPEEAARLAGDALQAAATVGATAVVRYLMDQYRDRPPEDKLRLLGAFAPEGPVVFFAISGDHRATVAAMLDLGWWKDKAALADYLNRRNASRLTPLENANASYPQFGVQAKPEIAALIQKKLDEVKQPGK
jgi:hypothetical protein